MKRRLALLAAVMLMMVSCAAAEGSAAGVPGGYIRFDDALPQTLVPVFSGAEWADDRPVTGAVFSRFDEWTYGQVIMRGDTGYTLCCLMWLRNEQRWDLTSSTAAIRQDCAPEIVYEELSWGLDEEEREQHNIGYSFRLVYPASGHAVSEQSWFCGSNGWQLQGIVIGGQGVSMNSREITWADESVYNMRDISLEGFVLADFPKTIDEARALAAADPVLNDNTAGIVVYAESAYSDRGRDVCPCAPVYDMPGLSAKQVAWMTDDTAVTVLEERDGFVRIRVGEEEPGWIPRENVRIGLERVTRYLSFSRVRVLGEAGAETAVIYDAPDGSICGEISTRKVAAITLMSMDGEWVYVMDDETGVSGWIPGGKAGLTDNYATCVVFNDKPENRLHLRAAPSRSADSLGKYYTGVVVDMLWQEKAADGWRKVSVGGIVGWMNTEYLSFASDGNYSGYLPPLRKIRGAVGGEGANMRASANPDAAIVRRLPNGTPVEIMGISGEWGHIRLKDNTTGWMRLHLLGGEPEKADAWAVTLLKDAMDDTGLNVIFPAGTKVCMSERPSAQWHLTNWRDGDWSTEAYSVPEEVVVFKDGVSARVPLEDVDCGW